MQQSLAADLLANSFDSCYYYATNQAEKFLASTDGPRHRALVSWVMNYKHTNSIIREKIVARVLGLVHNPRLHSTHLGVTTYDATDATTGAHYEIKTEQHNSACGHISKSSGQLSGSGMFGNITCAADLADIVAKDPVIAHGMFIDGILCGVATFKLSSATVAVDRIKRYCQSKAKTVPRYSYSDWGNDPSTNFRIFNYRWPETVSVKYRTRFQQAADSGLAQII